MTIKKYAQKAVKVSDANFKYISTACKEIDSLNFQSFNTILTAILKKHDKHGYTNFLKALNDAQNTSVK